MGVSGASAAGVGMSGDALNVNMVNAGITVDVKVGASVEVSNDTGGPLYIAGASGASGGTGPSGASGGDGELDDDLSPSPSSVRVDLL